MRHLPSFWQSAAVFSLLTVLIFPVANIVFMLVMLVASGNWITGSGVILVSSLGVAIWVAKAILILVPVKYHSLKRIVFVKMD